MQVFHYFFVISSKGVIEIAYKKEDERKVKKAPIIMGADKSKNGAINKLN
jgi:hypothetical protein